MKKIIVIGAGLAGLTAGIYLQSSGFDVTIMEQCSAPGGMCTGWKRKGYYFEGALNWLTGSSSKSSLNKVWQETGVISNQTKQYLPEIVSTAYIGETPIYLFSDPEKMCRYFLELSPEDEKPIRQLYKDIRKMQAMNLPVSDIKGLKTEKKAVGFTSTDMLNMMRSLPRMIALTKMSVSEYLESFQHIGIKLLLNHIAGEGYNAMAMAAALAGYANGDGAYLAGGSNGMIERMVNHFESSGGTLKLNTCVEKVTVENKKATGVFVNGEHISADSVVVTLDTLVAVERLFDTRIEDKWVEKMKNSTEGVGCTFVSMGLQKELDEKSTLIVFKPKKSFVYKDIQLDSIVINQYAKYDYAPKGCTALCIPLVPAYEFWKNAREKGKYQEEKECFGEVFKEAILSQFPSWRGKLEVLDIATPLTYERYCGSYKGTWMSIMRKGEMNQRYPRTVKNISNLFFAGQRLITPGGMPVAVSTGRTAAQHVCKYFDSFFRVPEL